MSGRAELRVAIANWSSRRVGGVEDYLSILVPALHEAGIAVCFWHEVDDPADRPCIDLPDGTPDICAARLGVDAALSAVRDWRPDVIYTHGLLDVGVERRLLDVAPSVFFLHSYSGTCISGGKTFTRPVVIPCERRFGWPCLVHYFPHGCGGRSPVTMWRHFVKQSDQLETLHRYALIITHTEHMQREMAKHGLRCDVVPYPVEARSGGKSEPRAGAWRLLYAARMDYLKGGRFLLDALPLVAAAAKRPVTLTLAGDGPYRVALETQAQEIETAGVSTKFLGWVTQDRVAALMEQTDLLVVPSVWPEPFGSIGPTAGQHGIPAAAFDVGGISQWLEEGMTGHMADANPPTPSGLARAILKCLQDERHYAELSEGARRMSGRFTIERHIPELLASFARVMG